MGKQQNEQDDEKQGAVLVTVIVDNHEHNGAAIKKGETVEVDEGTAAWMRENKIIEG